MNLIAVREAAKNSSRWVTLKEGNLIKSTIEEVDAATYIETGTANGYSTAWAVLGMDPTGHVETFDPVDRPKIWDEAIAKRVLYTQDSFKSEGKKYKHPIVFFLDGDHSQKGLREDFEQVEPLLEPGDVILFHDLNIEAIQRFCLRLKSRKPDWNFVDAETERRMLIALVR
jgi:predicted O-methyltransferase YrrM